jgi:Raf kinase inhibitor-like YbhB/YbcL family protein
MKTIQMIAGLGLMTLLTGGAPALDLTSKAFVDGGTIQNQFTFSFASQCNGNNWSPPLKFGGVPSGTQSFALRVVDPDGGNWLHWLAWNIPAGTKALPYNVSAHAGFDQGNNDFGTSGYGGPCPPTPNHHYVFTLYALNTVFASQPTTNQLTSAALQSATLTGLRSPTDNVNWTPPTPFADVSAGAWSYDYVLALADTGITTGCTPGVLYCPSDNVMRDQMAVFIIRALEGNPVAGYCGSVAPFTDVPASQWACGHIKRMQELSISNGYGDGTYGPSNNVTRAQMAVFIIRALEGNPVAGYCGASAPFSDVAAGYWACGHIKRMQELGITTGYPDGSYHPEELVTREQMAAFLSRAFLGM